MKHLPLSLSLGAVLTGAAMADDYSGWKETHPDWVPVIMDEMDGPELNPKHFRRFDYYNGHAPNWFRYQSKDKEMIEFTGKGTAILWGRYGRFTSQNDQAGDKDTYACGGFWTRGVLDFQYGYVEVRARFDNVQGTWPAIWLVPTHETCWPLKGEIDVLEHVNDQDIAHQNLHSPYEGNNGDYTRGPRPVPVIDNHAWNTYGVLWEEGKISFFLNGKCTWEGPADNFRWPFDNPGNTFYLIVDQQIGGVWCEGLCKGGIDREVLAEQGARYEIDYVHVYTYPDKALPALEAGVDTKWSSAVGVRSLNQLVMPVQSGCAATVEVDADANVQDLQVSGGKVKFLVSAGKNFRVRSITLSDKGSVAIHGPARLERFAGKGLVELMPAKDGNITITASESPFAGTLLMKAKRGHVIFLNNARTTTANNTVRGVRQVFEPVDGKFADWDIRGASVVIDNGFIRPNALKIGTLSGVADSKITGAWNPNVQQDFRYIAVHQDVDSTYMGVFADDKNRSVGLLKNGKGTLTLTGKNASQANLEVLEGGITLTGRATWSGNVFVAAEATLTAEEGATVDSLTVSPKATLKLGKLACSGSVVFAPGSEIDASCIEPAPEVEILTAKEISGADTVQLITAGCIRTLQVRPSRTVPGAQALVLILPTPSASGMAELAKDVDAATQSGDHEKALHLACRYFDVLLENCAPDSLTFGGVGPDGDIVYTKRIPKEFPVNVELDDAGAIMSYSVNMEALERYFTDNGRCEYIVFFSPDSKTPLFQIKVTRDLLSYFLRE